MGWSGSICALITPFDRAEALDLGALRRLIDWHAGAGTQALVIAGSTGEAALLDDSEYAALIEQAVACANKRLPIIAGIGAPSTAKSMKLAKLAKQAGVDALLAVTPYYVRPTQNGLLAHFLHLADADLPPLMLYNVPGRTGCDLQPETVGKLCRHDNIVAVKEARADAERMTELLALQSPGFAVLSGDDPTALRAMTAGARGVISVAANVLPQAFSELCRLALSGQADAAARLDSTLSALYDVLGLESNPIPAKYALSRLGYCDNVLRLPLQPLAAQYQQAVNNCLANLDGLLSVPTAA